MDRKSVIVLAICGLLFAVWHFLTPKLYPPQPPGPTNLTSSAVVQPGGSNAPSLTAPAANPNPAAQTPTSASFAQPASNTPEELFVVTNDLARFTFTSRGGGIKLVELLKHRDSVACGAKKRPNADQPVSLNGPAGQPILALTGSDALSGDGAFKLSRFVPTPPASAAGAATNATRLPASRGPLQGIRAEKLHSNGVFQVNEFELADDYLVRARVRFENRGSNDIALPPQNWMVGAATPLNAQDDGQAVGLTWFDGSETQINNPYFENRTLGCFPGTPRSDYAALSPSIRWAAAKNQFFFIALMPDTPAMAVSAGKFSLPSPSREEIDTDAKTRTNQVAFNVVLTQPGTNIAAGSVLERGFQIYAGPKEMRRLERLASQMKNEIDRLMEFGFFGFFSRLLLLSMNGLNSVGLSYALAIIAITVIIKLLFWPLTQASTRSMKRMQALQPQMKALQEKFKDDKPKMNKKLMEFMKENKVSPLGGCLPLLLQIPVFIGFFQMVRTAIELRGASFLWACDLSRPDTIFVIPGLNFNVNPLPLLMGITMFWQARLTPPAPGMDPMQQKMMKYFPLIFLFILYDYSAGLTLYWTVQNLLSIAQTKLTRISDGKKGPLLATKSAAPTAPGPRRKK